MTPSHHNKRPAITVHHIFHITSERTREVYFSYVYSSNFWKFLVERIFMYIFFKAEVEQRGREGKGGRKRREAGEEVGGEGAKFEDEGFETGVKYVSVCTM